MNKWLKLVAVLAVATLVLYGCGGATDDEQPQTDEQEQIEEDATENGTTDDGATENGATSYDEDAARAAYEKGTCMSCHGGNLEGSSGPALDTVGQRYSKDEIISIIDNGQGTMPALGNMLSDEEKEQLASWLADQK